MKITTISKNKKTVKLSKKDWENIGRKAKWIKITSMPQQNNSTSNFARRIANLQSQIDQVPSLEEKQEILDAWRTKNPDVVRELEENIKKMGYTVKGFHGSPDFIGNDFDRQFLGRNIGLSRGGFSFAPDKASAEAYMQRTMDQEDFIVDEAKKVINELSKRDPEEQWEGPYGETWGIIDFRANNVDDLEGFQEYLYELADSLKSDFPDLANQMLNAAKQKSRNANPRLIEAWLKNPEIVNIHGKSALIVDNPENIMLSPLSLDNNGHLIGFKL